MFRHCLMLIIRKHSSCLVSIMNLHKTIIIELVNSAYDEEDWKRGNVLMYHFGQWIGMEWEWNQTLWGEKKERKTIPETCPAGLWNLQKVDSNVAERDCIHSRERNTIWLLLWVFWERPWGHYFVLLVLAWVSCRAYAADATSLSIWLSPPRDAWIRSVQISIIRSRLTICFDGVFINHSQHISRSN